GILYLIESKVRNRQLQSTNLKGISEYSLEHIMPKKWENHWGKLSDKEAKQNRDRKLLTLGNLTIIPQALNSAVRDSKWETKKKGAKGHEGLIKYSSGIETFQKYLHFDIWNENGIQERANELSGLALKVWDIN
ncbi:MAG: HNH endonuclease family protein, partial [Chitinophagales bacterium]